MIDFNLLVSRCDRSLGAEGIDLGPSLSNIYDKAVYKTENC